MAGVIALLHPVSNYYKLELTKTKLCRLAEAQQEYWAAENDLADSVAELISSEHTAKLSLPKSYEVDGWGREFKYGRKGGIISSAGQDGEFYTDDDLDIVSFNFRYSTGTISKHNVERFDWGN